MKTVKKFSKLFLPAWILSGLIICAGIAGVCIKGINFGIDFRPGLIEEVRIASPAVEVKYDGTATVSLEVSTTELDVIVSGTGAENETYEFPFGKYSTVQAVAEGMNSIDGVSAVVKTNGSADSYGFYLNSAASAKLSAGVPLYLYVPDTTSAVKIDDIRATVSNVSGVLVKEMGTEENRSLPAHTPPWADRRKWEQKKTVLIRFVHRLPVTKVMLTRVKTKFFRKILFRLFRISMEKKTLLL